jgi:hypothetical protein
MTPKCRVSYSDCLVLEIRSLGHDNCLAGTGCSSVMWHSMIWYLPCLAQFNKNHKKSVIIVDQVACFCLKLELEFCYFFPSIFMFIVRFINLNVFWLCAVCSGVGKLASLWQSSFYVSSTYCLLPLL